MRHHVQVQRSTLMTEGPIARQLISFAFPLLLGNLFQQLGRGQLLQQPDSAVHRLF